MSSPGSAAVMQTRLVPRKALSVLHLIAFADAYLADDAVTEICVNRPREVWCEARSTWTRHEATELDLDHLLALATAVARYCDDDSSDTRPILSAVLPHGERVQIVRPPACEDGTVSVTIRKPTRDAFSLDDYSAQGFFDHVVPVDGEITRDEAELLALKRKGRHREFFARAVAAERVIVVAGETGSGKTTFMRSLIGEVPPEQRIITIEDTPELFMEGTHPNRVHLFYRSEDRDMESAVTATTLLRSCLRMKPTRIMLAELRGGETYDFLSVAASGHGGSITSCHAGSCELAFERLALMVLQNAQGRMLPYEVIRRLLFSVIDVVVHIHNDVVGGTGRHISEIWFDPAKKRAQVAT